MLSFNWHLERFTLLHFTENKKHFQFNRDPKNEDDSTSDTDEDKSKDDDAIGPTDADVRGVFSKISSYMQIVEKITIHMFPKAIILYIIREVEKFINTKLLVQIVNDIGEDNVSF